MADAVEWLCGLCGGDACVCMSGSVGRGSEKQQPCLRGACGGSGGPLPVGGKLVPPRILEAIPGWRRKTDGGRSGIAMEIDRRDVERSRAIHDARIDVWFQCSGDK